jgi:SNF2 domain-containing protein
VGEVVSLEATREERAQRRKSFGELVFHPPEFGVRQRGVWEVKAAPEVMLRLKRIFLRIDKGKRGKVFISDSNEVCRDMSWVLQRYPMELSAEARSRLKEGTREHVKTEELVTSILAGRELKLGTRVPEREPYEYQRTASNLIIANKRLLLVDDLGLGKTFSLLLTLQAEDALPALVVTLTHLTNQWLEELRMAFPDLLGYVVTKGTPYDPSEKRQMRGRQPDVLIMNYAKIAGWSDYLAGVCRTVLFDEIQELRRSDSDKYAGAALVADGAVYRAGCTATPVYNYGGEIHNVVSILDKDILGTREEFVREWGAGDSSDKLKVKEPEALGSYLRNEGIFLRRTRADVGKELPQTQRIIHTVETDPKVLFQLTSGHIDLADVILESGDHQQVFRASGEFDVQMRHATGVAKARYVGEFCKMLLESEEKIVLFGWHHDVYDIWRKQLKEFNPVFYTGNESLVAKEANAKRFMADNDLVATTTMPNGEIVETVIPNPDASRILIMSLRAGAGLNGIQNVCRVCVFGELDWSPGVHDQDIGRLRRDREGEHELSEEEIEETIAYFLVSNEGSDPTIAEVNNLKRMESEPMVNPGRPLLEGASEQANRIRLLAEEVKRQKERGQLPKT